MRRSAPATELDEAKSHSTAAKKRTVFPVALSCTYLPALTGYIPELLRILATKHSLVGKGNAEQQAAIAASLNSALRTYFAPSSPTAKTLLKQIDAVFNLTLRHMQTVTGLEPSARVKLMNQLKKVLTTMIYRIKGPEEGALSLGEWLETPELAKYQANDAEDYGLKEFIETNVIQRIAAYILTAEQIDQYNRADKIYVTQYNKEMAAHNKAVNAGAENQKRLSSDSSKASKSSNHSLHKKRKLLTHNPYEQDTLAGGAMDRGILHHVIERTNNADKRARLHETYNTLMSLANNATKTHLGELGTQQRNRDIVERFSGLENAAFGDRPRGSRLEELPYKGMLDRLQNAIKIVIADRERLQAENEALTTQARNITTEGQKHAAVIAELRAQVAAQQETINTLGEKNRALEEEVTDRQATLEEFVKKADDRINETTQQLEDANQQLEETTHKLTTSKQHTKQLKARLAGVEAELTSTLEKANALETALAAAKAGHSEADAQIAALKDQSSEQSRAVSEKEARIVELTRQVEAASSQVKALKRRLATGEQQSSQLEAALAAIEAANQREATLRVTNQEQAKAVQEQREVITRLNEKTNALHQEVTTLKAKIAASTKTAAVTGPASKQDEAKSGHTPTARHHARQAMAAMRKHGMLSKATPTPTPRLKAVVTAAINQEYQINFKLMLEAAKAHISSSRYQTIRAAQIILATRENDYSIQSVLSIINALGDLCGIDNTKDSPLLAIKMAFEDMHSRSESSKQEGTNHHTAVRK